jgi:hypothetical protein
MTTSEILKALETAKSEEEMLAIAEKLGVTRAFFNAGSAIELAANLSPKKITPKTRIKRKTVSPESRAKARQLKKTQVTTARLNS